MLGGDGNRILSEQENMHNIGSLKFGKKKDRGLRILKKASWSTPHLALKWLHCHITSQALSSFDQHFFK